jgi:hypothetical protein
MKAQIPIQIETKMTVSGLDIFPHDDYQNRERACPNCGQGSIPFKVGVCICGMQVGKIQYVNNPQKIVKQYYTYVSNPNTEKLGIAELVDN